MRELDLPGLLPEALSGLTAYDPPKGGCPVRLDANECPYPPDPQIVDEIRETLEGVDLNRYPDPASEDLRSAFGRRFGCPTENVMAGNGSDELIGLLTWTLRGSRGGNPPVVVVPVPTFGMYSIAARAAGYTVPEIPLGPGLEPDMEAMLRAVREQRPSLVFLSNPNNPTGTFYSRDQIRALLDISSGLLVVDEAYGDFSGEPSWAPEVLSSGNLAVLRTLSKIGAAALRCGFLVASTDLLREVNKVRFPFNLSRYTQAAGEVFLRRYDLVKAQVTAVVKERGRLSREFEKLGFAVFPSRGNFLFVQCAGREEALWRFLQETGIMVKFLSRLPVTGDALRISVGSPEENDLLLNRSRGFVAEGGMDA